MDKEETPSIWYICRFGTTRYFVEFIGYEKDALRLCTRFYLESGNKQSFYIVKQDDRLS